MRFGLVVLRNCLSVVGNSLWGDQYDFYCEVLHMDFALSVYFFVGVSPIYDIVAL